MGEYGHEGKPREPFRYRLCPFCEYPVPSLAIYWDIARFSCRHCSIEGTITRTPDRHYPTPPFEIEAPPERKGYG
jgi:hypothetical protein